MNTEQQAALKELDNALSRCGPLNGWYLSVDAWACAQKIGPRGIDLLAEWKRYRQGPASNTDRLYKTRKRLGLVP